MPPHGQIGAGLRTAARRATAEIASELCHLICTFSQRLRDSGKDGDEIRYRRLWNRTIGEPEISLTPDMCAGPLISITTNFIENDPRFRHQE
jgi:hypothetical protein